ncbi:MAG: protein translocase subunit SecD, partial [Alphaproteobacteria bacterium]|nr:protein translocase subunit SecD [Alphaproteobacteria bacterium]
MLHFATWSKVLIILACLAGVFFSIPNLIPATTLDKLPNWLPKHQVNLGLDLRGGSHLLLEVDYGKALHDLLENVVDNARTALRNARIGYSALSNEGDRVVVQLRDYDQMKRDGRQGEVEKLFHDLDPELVTTVSDSGQVTIRYGEAALASRRHNAVIQSIEIIRRRIDENGTKEATIQQEGEDRILVQVPGIDDPERLKKIIGQTAKMTFQLVDTASPLEEAQHGHLPPGDEVLQGAPDARRPGQAGAFVVQKRVMVSGDSLVDAQPTFQNNEPVVSFKFDARGGRLFGEATQKNVGRPFAIVLDGKVISAPVIREAILGGSGIISGSFTVQTATDLALLLRAGALPAPIVFLEERTVGPDLGADSIHAGATACIVGVILVVIFMVVFYGLFGIFADIALVFNMAIMIACLSLLGATLTLPGIAGIALTMGMAVDANVLIYERIREELRSGRSMLSSLDAGFKRAFGTILDSHVTTLVAGALLFGLGSGPVKGFAVTLSIGVLTSLFSAILVTRLQIVSWLQR